MNIAHIEDNEKAHEKLRNCIAAKNAQGQQLILVDKLSPVIQEFPDDIFKDVLQHLESHKGSLALIVDLALDTSSELRAELRAKYDIPGFVEDKVIEGVIVAKQVILNHGINPALIVFASSRGWAQDIEQYLKGYLKTSVDTGKLKPERLKQVAICTSPHGFLAAAGYDSSYQLVEYILTEYKRRFGTLADNFFSSVWQMTHNEFQSPAAKTIVATLLDLEMNDFLDKFGSEPTAIYEALKTMGSPWEDQNKTHQETALADNDAAELTRIQEELSTKTVEAFSASAGWLLALAAFRHKNPNADWQQIFNTKQLLPELRQHRIAPPQKAPTSQRTVRAFYDMCCCLFERKEGEPSHPLQAVSLSESSGLCFFLNFDCTHSPTGKSLQQKIAACFESSFKEEGLPHNHLASKAIWRFYLASSIADGSNLNEGIFGDPLRLNILKDGQNKTRVVFR
jgi:hypothetical protein